MNKSDNNENSPEDIKSLLIKSFFGPFLQQMGQGMGLLIILGIGLLLLQHMGDGDGGGDARIALVVGTTTAGVLVTMLETPLVVAVGVGILVWWIVQQAM